MSISKVGAAELDVSLRTVGIKVQSMRDSVLASLEKKDLKGLSEVSKVSGKDAIAYAGMKALKYMIEDKSVRHATTGKLRLYKGIFSKTEYQQNYVRFLREAIAEEYKNEWSDILDSDEGFVLVNPNQRAKYGALLYSMPVVATPATHRYLNYLTKKLGKSMRVVVHPVMVLPTNNAETRENLLPRGGFENYGDPAINNKIPLEALREMMTLMMEAMRVTVTNLKEGKSQYTVYGPDQLVQVCKKNFVDPNLKVSGMSLIDIQKKYKLEEHSPVNLASRFNRMFQVVFSDVEKLCNIARISRGEAERLVEGCSLMRVCRGEVPYTMAYQVDVSAVSLYNNQAMDFAVKSSVYNEFIMDAQGQKPQTYNEAVKRITGIDLLDWLSRSEDSLKASMDHRSVTDDLSKGYLMDGALAIPGGNLGTRYSSRRLAKELSVYLTIFRTLMRKNLWLNLK